MFIRRAKYRKLLEETNYWKRQTEILRAALEDVAKERDKLAASLADLQPQARKSNRRRVVKVNRVDGKVVQVNFPDNAS